MDCSGAYRSALNGLLLEAQVDEIDPSWAGKQVLRENVVWNIETISFTQESLFARDDKGRGQTFKFRQFFNVPVDLLETADRFELVESVIDSSWVGTNLYQGGLAWKITKVQQNAAWSITLVTMKSDAGQIDILTPEEMREQKFLYRIPGKATVSQRLSGQYKKDVSL